MNSRPQKSRNQVWRRRKCDACNRVVTTIEYIDLAAALTVNKDASEEPFERDKLFLSLYDACRHRPSAPSDARALAQTAIAHIVAASLDGRIASSDVTAIVHQILRRFDTSAAVSYAAFHPATKRRA